MLGRTDSRARMVLVMLVFVMVATAATVRLGQWQIVESGELSARFTAVAELANQPKVTRAEITDRDGVVLARTSSFDQVVAYVDRIDPSDEDGLSETLGILLDADRRQRSSYLDALAEARSRQRLYAILEPRITLEQSDAVQAAIEAGALGGLGLEPHDVRYYPKRGGEPHTTLASGLLGFVSADGVGGEGIERRYDERLSTAGAGAVDTASLQGVDVSAIDPAPLQLTIDAGLQRQVEEELWAVKSGTFAKSVSAIVMDPRTGAILAAASVPAYNAEDYAAIAADDISILRNRVFQDQYEPGSVMKIFTATAALDLGLVTPNTIIRDQQQLRFWEDTVHNADRKTAGDIPVKDVIALSRNVATAKIAAKLAPTVQRAGRRLYTLWDKVGLVGRTGVDVVGEAPGMAYDPGQSTWSAVDLANRAFGQGASFTLPQLARGMSVLVNGGYLVQPHLVTEGDLARVKPERVLKAKTAQQAKDILRHVTGSVTRYAAGALIPGYDIGGKTGTAQIWDVRKADWKKRRFNHSFVGFVGGRKEEYVIAVRLEEPVPQSVKQGSIPLDFESFETFQMVARATIDQLDMKRSKVPGAGLPILGTDAARALTPDRNRAAARANKAERRAAERQAAKLAKARREAGGSELAALAPAQDGSGDDGA